LVCSAAHHLLLRVGVSPPWPPDLLLTIGAAYWPPCFF
jgi:hypothetical protein